MMADFSMHVLDIVQNSIKANATNIAIEIMENTQENLFLFSVSDNGCGMSKEMLANVRNPFTTSRTTRKVGLGIPMLEESCDLCGGSLILESELSKGTFIKATMQHDNIDRPPLGNLAESIYILIISNPEIDFNFIYSYNDRKFIFNTIEVKEVLEGLPLTEPSVMQWIKENIADGISDILLIK